MYSSQQQAFRCGNETGAWLQANPARWDSAIVVALDMEGGFAKEKRIPWYYSEDLKYFSNLTKDGVCVMGKNTYLEINEKLGEKAEKTLLSDRISYVVSSTLTDVTNAIVVNTIDEVYADLLKKDHYYNKKIYFIGGMQIFESALNSVNAVITTVINKSFDCDQKFPIDILQKRFRIEATTKSVELPHELGYFIWTRK